jgi:hypothetical protein
MDIDRHGVLDASRGDKENSKEKWSVNEFKQWSSGGETLELVV